LVSELPRTNRTFGFSSFVKTLNVALIIESGAKRLFTHVAFSIDMTFQQVVVAVVTVVVAVVVVIIVVVVVVVVVVGVGVGVTVAVAVA
jgi:hypothetical protein